MPIIIPYIVAFLAVSCYALLGPIAKKVGANLPAFGFIACSSLILFLSAGVVSLIVEKQTILSEFKKINWWWLLAFSVTNLIGYVGYLWAIQKIPIVHYEMFAIIAPVIAGIFAVYLLNEPFHPRYLLALVFMAIGLAIAVKPKL